MSALRRVLVLIHSIVTPTIPSTVTPAGVQSACAEAAVPQRPLLLCFPELATVGVPCGGQGSSVASSAFSANASAPPSCWSHLSR